VALRLDAYIAIPWTRCHTLSQNPFAQKEGNLHETGSATSCIDLNNNIYVAGQMWLTNSTDR